jgi:hypothetical protein
MTHPVAESILRCLFQDSIQTAVQVNFGLVRDQSVTDSCFFQSEMPEYKRAVALGTAQSNPLDRSR